MFKVTCLVDPRRKVGPPQNLVLEVLKNWFWHNVTYCEANTCNQLIKCNKHELNECIE
jgi:hypothetical protein